LLRYHGQFAPQGRWRDQVVISPRKRKKAGCPTGPDDQRKRLRWAELLRRAFLFDVLRCHRCGGRRELIAVIKDSRTVTRILDHVGIKSIAPSFKSARGPPQQHWCEDNWD
jgi:hypothetical protein